MHFYWLKLYVKILCIFNCVSSLTACTRYDCIKNETETLPFCLPRDYVKEREPSAYKTKDREVFLYPQIIEMEDIDILESTITFRVYLEVSWTDSRILIRKDLINNLVWQPLDLEVKNFIWTPDLNLDSAKHTYKDEIFLSEGIKVNGLKSFLTYIAFSAEIKCGMDLGNFPHDQQKCSLAFASLTYPDGLLSLKLKEHHYVVDFPYPKGYTIRINKWNKTGVFTDGNFTMVGLEFTMVRHISFYMVNYYIPTGLMVIISFASFAIPTSSEGLLGRIASMVTLVLVVMGIFNTAKSNLPASEDPNYLEIWMIVCILFLLGSLAQSTMVFLILRIRNIEEVSKISSAMVTPISKTSETESNNSSEHIHFLVNENTALCQEKFFEKVDMVSFVIFTILFVMFNIIFWSITMTSL